MPRARIHWISAIYPVGSADVFGGMWGNEHLYPSRLVAMQEADAQAHRMGLDPIEWETVDNMLTTGRTRNAHTQQYAAIVRGLRGSLRARR